LHPEYIAPDEAARRRALDEILVSMPTAILPLPMNLENLQAAKKAYSTFIVLG